MSTPTLYIITATLPPTLTLQPTYSPLPPSPIPTIAPVEGITTTKVNVRELPSITSYVFGQLGIFVKVEITGKDPAGDWYRIKYSPDTMSTSVAPNYSGMGWVDSEYIQVTGNVAIPDISPVLSTPSIPFASSFTQVFQTPSGNSNPTPQSIPALASVDDDSAQNPAIDINFSPTDARSITYTSDVSSPQGDPDDWLRFQPYLIANGSSAVSVIIKCAGSSGLNIELIQVPHILQVWENTSCKTTSRLLLSLYGTAPYLLRISPGLNGGNLNYVSYEVTIQQDN